MAKSSWIKGVILALLIAIGGWALFQLAYTLIEISLNAIGLVNEIYKNLAIVLLVIIVMILGWKTGLKTAVKKLVR